MIRRFPAHGLAALIVALLPAVARAEDVKPGMPQLDPSTYPSQLFWLLVFFVLFYLFGWKVAMPRVGGIIARRQAQISGDLGQATAASAEAQRLNRELDAGLSTAREEAQALIVSATSEIRDHAAAQDEVLNKDLVQRIEHAESSINASRDAALGTIDTISGGIVQETLVKLAHVEIDSQEAARAIAQVDLKKG